MNKSPLEELIEKYILYSIEYTFIHVKNDVLKNRDHLSFYTCHADHEKKNSKIVVYVTKKKIIFD